MLKIAFIYGAISGAVIITVMSVGLALGGSEHGAGSQIFGYGVMLVALCLIFLGVKRHRDHNLNGAVKFLPALGAGVAIAAVAAIIYVIGWEINLAVTDYAYIKDYAAAVIEKKQAAGASAEELRNTAAIMDAFAVQYKTPAFRLPMTFAEIFPVGFVVAVISAVLLRNPNVFPARAAL